MLYNHLGALAANPVCKHLHTRQLRTVAALSLDSIIRSYLTIRLLCRDNPQPDGLVVTEAQEGVMGYIL